MLRKVCYAITLAFLFSIVNSCSTQTTKHLAAIQKRGELVVAMDYEMPGYFELGGESYGYPYDLFKAYAQSLGVELRVVNKETASTYMKQLRRGKVDFFTTQTHAPTNIQPKAIPVYSTSYVLLAGRKKAREIKKTGEFSLLTALKGHKLLMSTGFKTSKSYDLLLDSLSGEYIDISSRNSFELIEALGDGKYDYLICEKSEAQLGCALMRNVQQVYAFSEEVSFSVFASPKDEELHEHFMAWLQEFRQTKEYALLNELYFNKGILAQVRGKGLDNLTGRISMYDKMFKELAEREGYDWRLVSAIAYSESRFNPLLISKRGARGIMQVMPHTANLLGAKGDIMDPEKNVMLALKLLAKIEKSLQMGSGTSDADRIKIVLACYNAGVGHVMDARNLARKYGSNPDSWDDVSFYLSRKSDPQMASDAVVKCGRFNGKQTLAFVDQVTQRYQGYCNRVQR